MVFEHRSAQNSIRTAPLPIIKDHHSSHRYKKKNGATAAAFAMASNGHHTLNSNNKQKDNNNNNNNNSNNYHQKLINLFRGNNQQATNGQHTASKPIAINNAKSNSNHLSRMDSLPETPPIEASLPVGARSEHEQAQQEKYSYRQRPLTIEEYENELRPHAGDLELIERIFYGGIGSNKLRAALWPHIFGLVSHRGRFIKKSPNLSNGTNGPLSRLPSSAPPCITRSQSNGHVTTGHSNGHTNGNSISLHQTSQNYTSNSLTNGHSNGGPKSLTRVCGNGYTRKHTNGNTNCDSALKTNGHLGGAHTNGHHSPNGVSLSDRLGKTTSTNGTAMRRQNHGHKRESGRPSSSKSLDDNFIYLEHEDNLKRWRELGQLYRGYESQWKSVTPDQESRFSVFRERKALIERDVVRSDRSHPFYADSSTNLNNFTALLMTYMMYDFDIGYLQGMSDLAAPILYVYQGDLVKSFWVFVEVMKLFRGNFEQSQKTIHFQLNCLYRLIKLTEPKLAYHLRDNDCSNCFFVFRCIVCQFKRELMKSRSSSAACHDPDEGYAEVLNLWDTIWSVERRNELLNSCGRRHGAASCQLTESEKFILSLCLSLIRRERDHILKCLDASEIHQHFINPHLTRHFDQFVDQAYGVYQYLNWDCDLQLLVRGADRLSGATSSDLSPICNGLLAADEAPDETEPDTYDLLKDYLIISPTAYNIPLLPANGRHLASNTLTCSNAADSDSSRHTEIQANSPSSVASGCSRISATKYRLSQRSWDLFLHRDQCLA